MNSTALPPISLQSATSTFRRSNLGRVAVCIVASLFVAIAAHFSMPLPWTPVPTTLQPFAVLLVGMILGPVDGFAALSLYLAEGAAGLPVFSPTGPGGLWQLLGPTGGYLISYPFAAALTGSCVRVLRRRLPDFAAGLLSGLAGGVLIFAMGALRLAQLMHLTVIQAFHLAVAPFLLSEMFKLTAAAGAYKALRMSKSR